MSNPIRTVDASFAVPLSRRAVLKHALVVGGAAFLAACGASTSSTPTAAPTAGPTGSPAPSGPNFTGTTLNCLSGAYSLHAELIGLAAWKGATGGDATFSNVAYSEKAAKVASIIDTQDASWDIVYTDETFMVRFGQRLLIPVADWYGDASDFVPATIVEFSSPDGILRGLPFHHSGYAWAWNKKLFAKAGLDPEKPPDNWPDLIAATPKFAAAGILPCVQPWLATDATLGDFYFKQMYNSLDVPFLSPDRTKVGFGGPEGLQVFQLIERGLKAGYWDPRTLTIDQPGAFTLWDKGDRYATLVIDPDSVPTLPAGDFGIRAMPGMVSGKTGTVNADDGIGISRFSTQQEACKSYFAHTFSNETAREICVASPELYPPTRLSLLNDPQVLAANPAVAYLKQQAVGSESLWPAPYDYSPVFDDVLRKLVKGTVDAVGAQAAAVKGVQDLIAKYSSS